MVVIIYQDCGTKRYRADLQKFTRMEYKLISAISIASRNVVDYEYLRIIQELRSIGLSPTGNKNADKARLEQQKTELINKIQHKESEDNKQTLQAQVIVPVDDTENAKKSEMETQRLGALTLAELNKIYFNL